MITRPVRLLFILPGLVTTLAMADGINLPQVKVADSLPDTVSRATANLVPYGNLPAQQTPAAIRHIGAEQIHQRQLHSLHDLTRTDSALSDSYAPIGYYQNIAIRGVPLDVASGYRMNNLVIVGEQMAPLAAVEQVQVLKGMAGINAGIVSPGGVVNYVSKRPRDIRKLTLGTDSEGSQRVALDVGKWLTDRVGIRFNMAARNIHSYIDYADGQQRHYAFAADWYLGERSKLELDASYQTYAQPSVAGYQLLGGTDIPDDIDWHRMLGHQPWTQPLSLHASNTSLRFKHAFNHDWHLLLAAGHSHSKVDDYLAFPYGCYYQASCYNGTPGYYFSANGGYDIYDYRRPNEEYTTDQATLEVSGNLRGKLRHHLTLGYSLLQRKVRYGAALNVYVGSANIHQPTPQYPPAAGQAGEPHQRLDHVQQSIYLLDQLTLTQQWKLLLGGRLVLSRRQVQDAQGQPLHDDEESVWLPQAAVVWSPTDQLNTYLSYSRGLAFGKAAPFWASNAGDMLGMRHARQTELGMKYRWPNGLHTQIALFHTQRDNQFARPDQTAAGFTYVAEGNEVHTGLAVSLAGQLGAYVTTHSSISLIRARLKDTGVSEYEGHQVVNVPLLRTSVWLAWQLPWWQPLSLSAGWRHASENPATAHGDVKLDAWNAVDAGVHYVDQWQSRQWRIDLTVSNLFNHFYWRDAAGFLGDHYLFAAAPRLAQLSFSVEW